MRIHSTIIIFGTGLILAGCLGFGPQDPAPVSMFGVKAGPGSAGVHIVSGKETLYSISQRYNLVMRDIVIANNLSAPFALSAGQRLNLPPPRQYTAKPGDTLYQISRVFGASSTEIARLNGMRAPYTIEPGQRVRLPEVTAVSAPQNIAAASTAKAVPVASVSMEVLAPPPGMAVLPPKKPDIPQAQGEKVKLASAAVPAEKTRVTTSTPKRASSKFLLPVNGRLVSSYGPKESGLHNDGINIAAPKGTPIQVADNGVVVYAGNELKGSGNLVLVRHEGRWMTAYAHMDDVKVKRGDTVTRGQKIGTVGSTGSVDKPQLHFEVRRGTEALNPKLYLES
jgi:murein DD-endopeptidase MepM/ murein hydrolase activator NlpD